MVLSTKGHQPAQAYPDDRPGSPLVEGACSSLDQKPGVEGSSDGTGLIGLSIDLDRPALFDLGQAATPPDFYVSWQEASHLFVGSEEAR